jgi:hypothetical protein
MKSGQFTALIVAATLLMQSQPAFALEEDPPNLEIAFSVESKVISSPLQVSPLCEDENCVSGIALSDASTHSLKIGETSGASVQILINIKSSDAPKKYEFSIKNAVGMEPISNGEIFRLFDQEGETVSWLSKPWAIDAMGVSVPTRFEFRNGTLIQFVDFDASQHAFPVLADPYLWIDLISTVEVKSFTNYKKLIVAVTPWLGGLYVTAYPSVVPYGGGVIIAQTAGWAEVMDKVKAKYGSAMRTYIEARPTFKNQWDCHALGAPIIFVGVVFGTDSSPTWDLEGNRSPNANVGTWISTKCNW